MRVATLAIALLATVALLPVEADAGGKGGGRSSGGKSHAHRHHGGARVFIGAGVYYGWPYYYYYPYYNPADVLLYPPPHTDPYWYYCRAANAYYPYVQACAGGWERYLPGTPLS